MKIKNFAAYVLFILFLCLAVLELGGLWTASLERNTASVQAVRGIGTEK